MFSIKRLVLASGSILVGTKDFEGFPEQVVHGQADNPRLSRSRSRSKRSHKSHRRRRILLGHLPHLALLPLSIVRDVTLRTLRVPKLFSNFEHSCYDVSFFSPSTGGFQTSTVSESIGTSSGPGTLFRLSKPASRVRFIRGRLSDFRLRP